MTEQTTESEIQAEHHPPKPQFKSQAPNPRGTLISIALFVGIFLLLGLDLRLVFILLFVLLIHEMGHFIAMKHFGYKNVNMFFVPLFGAFVSGENDEATEKETVITVLAGPVPGIFLGLIFLYLEKSLGLHQLKMLPEILLSLNILNLLPIIPLDGGRLIEAMFISGRAGFEKFFLVLSLLLVVFLAWKLGSFPALFIAVFILLRLRSSIKNDKLRAALKKEGLDYHQSYSQLSDEQFWKMENIIRKKSGGQDVPLTISSAWVRNLLQPVPKTRLSIFTRLLIVLFWLVCLIIPVYIYFSMHAQLFMEMQQGEGILA